MTIFTIGYGGRRFADFVSLLQQHNIALVVDIRRFPKSTVPEFKIKKVSWISQISSPLKGEDEGEGGLHG